MYLTLIIDNPRILDGGLPSTKKFDASGGVLGSANACDWLLHDSLCTVQEQHLKVFVQDDYFCATPLCDEGIYINGSQRPMRKGSTFRICDGDNWRIGDFLISAYLSLASKDTASDQMAGRFSAIEKIVPGALSHKDTERRGEMLEILEQDPSKAPPLRNLHAFEHKDEEYDPELDPMHFLDQDKSTKDPSQLDPVKLLEIKERKENMSKTSDLAESLELKPDKEKELSPVDQPPPQGEAFAASSVKHPVGSGQEQDKEIDDYLSKLEGEVIGQTSDQNLPVAPRFDSHAPPTGESQQMVDHIVLRPLLEAMKLSAGEMSVPQSNQMLAEIGRGVLATIKGLMAIHDVHDKDRNHFADTHLHPVEDNPLRLSRSVEEAMHDLFMKISPVHLSAEAAIEESLRHIADHENASRIATEAALDSLLLALDPQKLTQRFARYKGHAPRTGNTDAWNWQMYQYYYRELSTDRQRGLARMFWEVFQQVYDREMRTTA